MNTLLPNVRRILFITLAVIGAAVQAQTISVPATASGQFGSPSDGGTNFVSGYQFTSVGQTITVNASGTILFGPSLSAGPNGTTVSRSVLIGPFGSAYTPLEEKVIDGGGSVPISDPSSTVQNVAALIAAFVPATRVNSAGFLPRDSDVVPLGNGIFSSELFLVGAGPYDFTAPGAGTLYFGINEPFVSNNSGAFIVAVPEASGMAASSLMMLVVAIFHGRRVFRKRGNLLAAAACRS